jgi:hypothetical protein
MLWHHSWWLQELWLCFTMHINEEWDRCKINNIVTTTGKMHAKTIALLLLLLPPTLHPLPTVAGLLLLLLVQQGDVVSVIVYHSTKNNVNNYQARGILPLIISFLLKKYNMPWNWYGTLKPGCCQRPNNMTVTINHMLRDLVKAPIKAKKYPCIETRYGPIKFASFMKNPLIQYPNRKKMTRMTTMPNWVSR